MRTAWRTLPALLLAVAAPAHAEERILHYLSDVQIQKDSSLEVTETIDVRAENDRIKHGIYRDFPTHYRGRNGSQVRVGFTFEGATLDGAPVPASTEPYRNGVRIKVGDPDKYVDVGEHSYVLQYRATRQIGRFANYDELYWNATGNGWIFPIDSAEARIKLPSPVPLSRPSAYTGPQGSTASNAEVVDQKPGEITFQTTQALEPYEGLTVAVAFPKGTVAEPSGAAYWLSDYGPLLIGLLALIGLLIFYYVAWQRVGRDPRPGTVVPIFAPPDDLSPAGMRYVTKMGADDRTFAAALVDLGVRGHVRLVEEAGGWFSPKTTRIERLTSSNPLPPEEERALNDLCAPGESIVMEQKNHTTFALAKTGLSDTLKSEYEDKLFKRNWSWAIAGLLFFGVALWLTATAQLVAMGSGDIWKAGTILGCMLVAGLLAAAFEDSTGFRRLLLKYFPAALFLAVNYVGSPIIGAVISSGWYLPLIVPALALPIVISAFWWIAAPTPEGRAVLDHIAGFKQYLSITERERLDRMTPPADTPEIFEKYLPYAIALGVENRWAERFASVLAAAAASGRQGFVWYSGSSNPWDNPTSFTHSVGASLASTISSASTAPGSSSGSGGGGSSGGGGGGGGGGGW